MKNLIILFVIVTIFSSCSSSIDKAELEKEEDKEWVIGAHGLGPIQLNKSLDQVKKIISKDYKIKNLKYGAFSVIQHDKVLVYVHSKYKDGKIGFIEIVSPKFKTADGIHCNMKIADLKKIRKDLTLDKDEMTGQEYFEPAELQDYPKKGGPPKTLNLIYMKSSNGKDLSESYVYDEIKGFVSKGEINNNGEVNSFHIYNWW